MNTMRTLNKLHQLQMELGFGIGKWLSRWRDSYQERRACTTSFIVGWKSIKKGTGEACMAKFRIHRDSIKNGTRAFGKSNEKWKLKRAGQEQRNKGPQWKGKRKAIVPFQKTQIPTQKKLVSTITGRNDFRSNGRHNPKRNLVGKEIWRRKGQQESSKQGEDKRKKGQRVQENIENIQIQPVGNRWLDRSAIDDDVDLSDRNKIANSTKGDQSVIDMTAEGEDGNEDVEDNNILTQVIDIRKAVRSQQLEESLSTEDSEHGTRSIPITQEQEQNMIDNELRTIIIAGVTMGIDFEEEDVMSMREMIEGEVQEFTRLQRNRRAKRSNSFTDVQAAMLTVLSAFQLLSFGGLRVFFHREII
ncbi:hypothetical protein RHSIM_RhsimUnG0121600 [Rhododendron simsii]|uniref:Uncharacterized protein n=1 Tax=Rhododendron simsii TaxID=118357 RepID=A0A834FYA4_RHOSS|nr:hypothetical protein RHSIM_RhsimUnG0121600 [Rhododendron simsii]